MKENEIIIVKQLPEIEQHLQKIKEEVTKKVNQAQSLVCTEDTVKDIKKVRAELNSELKEWESKRKEVKNAIMTPYDAFENVYKDCISNTYKVADKDLKSKIDSVESELKLKKSNEVIEYFNEYMQSLVTEIPLNDLITFEKANINITLSASMKSLKNQCKEFIDRVCDDLNLIALQEHKDEIFYEYRQTLNVSLAITAVSNRYKAIEEQKAREEQLKEMAETQKAVIEKVETAIEETPLAPPTIEAKEEKIVTLQFKVRGTIPKLKELKAFLERGNYDYE